MLKETKLNEHMKVLEIIEDARYNQAKYIFKKIFKPVDSSDDYTKRITVHAGAFKHYIQCELLDNCYVSREEVGQIMKDLGFGEDSKSKHLTRKYAISGNMKFMEKVGLVLVNNRIELSTIPNENFSKSAREYFLKKVKRIGREN